MRKMPNPNESIVKQTIRQKVEQIEESQKAYRAQLDAKTKTYEQEAVGLRSAIENNDKALSELRAFLES